MREERQAQLVGAGDGPFPGVVRHVLRNLGFRVGVTGSQEPPPDLLLVAVERGHVTRRIAAARARAHGAPIVAVLRNSDGELASRALAAGAHAFHALDTSDAYLRATVLTLLGLAPARPCRTVTASVPPRHRLVAARQFQAARA
jgi:DNA-binding NarL/FixJ family response regulator